MNIQDYGFRPSILLNPDTDAQQPEGIPARITAVHRERYAFVSDAGAGFAHLKASAYRAGSELFPTAGDFVLLDWQEAGESRILRTLPRTTCFTRRDPSSSGHSAQTVAANFDYVFILQSLDRDFRPRALERYLTLAWQSGAVPAILLTKSDCTEDPSAVQRAAEKLAVGVGVFAISAATGEGLDALGDYLKPGKTIVLLGPSGVGKSSLVNALAGGEWMACGDVRQKDGRGRHTTTHRQLMLLESGVMIIDTPGMRELGMWEAGEGLEKSFSDVEQYFGQCKFSDCRHQSEPGCAVKAAILRGELSQDHWESYRKLEAEARFADDKAGFLRDKEQWCKDISKFQRRVQKTDYRHEPCLKSFTCKVCGALVAPDSAGSEHRNHCPHCLSSLHVDNRPGDRGALCGGTMEPIGVWVRGNKEWAVIHRCRACGALRSNRIAADDNPTLLMSIAMKPLASPPFPLWGPEQPGGGA